MTAAPTAIRPPNAICLPVHTLDSSVEFSLDLFFGYEIGSGGITDRPISRRPRSRRSVAEACYAVCVRQYGHLSMVSLSYLKRVPHTVHFEVPGSP
jgi:hypothetical protein